MSFFHKQPKPTDHEVLHSYRNDVEAYTRLLSQQQQKCIIQPSEANTERLRRLEAIIDNMMRVVQRLSAKEANKEQK